MVIAATNMANPATCAALDNYFKDFSKQSGKITQIEIIAFIKYGFAL
jgi:hypothetical protein